MATPRGQPLIGCRELKLGAWLRDAPLGSSGGATWCHQIALTLITMAAREGQRSTASGQ